MLCLDEQMYTSGCMTIPGLLTWSCYKTLTAEKKRKKNSYEKAIIQRGTIEAFT